MDAADAIRRAAPPCPAGVRWCLGLRVHAVVDAGGQPLFPAARFAAQLAGANRHFGPVGIGFEVREVTTLPPDRAILRSARARDALSRHARTRESIDVFLVGTLVDIDAPGTRRGVHWRWRRDRTRTWVILSRKTPAPSFLLAHELGHFFDLPHTRSPASIMCKRLRAEPLPGEWTFTRSERARIRSKLKGLLASGRLRAHRSAARAKR